MNRLLIIACCQRKNPSAGLAPAIERYDGPTFRVLRKFLREEREHALEIRILSAKFGLIGPGEMIPDYDCRLTADAAKRLRPTVLAKLRTVLQSSQVKAVGLCLGRDYGQVVGEIETYLPVGTRLEHLSGGLGRRLTQLRDWLHKKGVASASDPKRNKTDPQGTGFGSVHRCGTATVDTGRLLTVDTGRLLFKGLGGKAPSNYGVSSTARVP